MARARIGASTRVEDRRQTFEAFARAWAARMGGRFALPSFDPATIAGFRVRSRGVRVGDLAFTGIETASAIRTTGPAAAASDEHVRLWIVHRGEYRVGEHPVPAGRLLVQAGRLAGFGAAPRTVARVLVLPVDALPRSRERTLTGDARLPEARLLTAHADMVRRTFAALGPAGLHAARDTLVELARAVMHGGLDDVEPRVAPALAQAARELADRRLTDPELSPAALARELHVSVRTLQRAFAAEGGSASEYIRERRLAAAHAALTAPDRRMTISEIAARWQFADSSHFGRAFRRRYGRTPATFGRER